MNNAGRALIAAALLGASLTGGGATAEAPLPLDRIRLPAGFVIELVARVPNARGMTWGERGTLFVGTASSDVYAVTLGERTVVRKVAAGLREPAGVAFRDGALYASSIDRIVRLPDIESRLDDPPVPVVVSRAYPGDAHHGRKFIAFGPDGKLYVPVGAPCNICAPDPDRYALMSRMNPDGSGLEIVARGIRNSVGFDWHPQTKELWFTDNGRDNLGDDAPPDELNRLTTIGQNFGYPYCHGGTIPDPAVRAAMPAANSRRRRRRSGRTSPRLECASTPARSFPRRTGTRSSSPSTDRGTAAARPAIASRSCAWMPRARPCRTCRSQKAGSMARARGGVPPTCCQRPTDRSSCPTISPARSTGSAFTAEGRPASRATQRVAAVRGESGGAQ